MKIDTKAWRTTMADEDGSYEDVFWADTRERAKSDASKVYEIPYIEITCRRSKENDLIEHNGKVIERFKIE